MPIRSKWAPPAARRPAPAARRRGITLMEAVVAIAVVGMTAVGALEAVGGDMRTAERAKRAIEVEALATSRLEAMNLLVDQELQSLPDSIKEGKFAPPLDEYTWKATSTPVSNQAGLYSVHVTVEWTNNSYELKTYMYRTPRLVTQR